MIDTHTHIYAPQFDADRDDVVKRAKTVGVEHLILPNENVSTIPLLYATEKAYPGYCSLAMGIHPEEVKDDYKQQLAVIEKELNARPFVAIGEVGIDLYRDSTYISQQRYAFQVQIEWSLRFNIPLILHVRNAWEETLNILQRYANEEQLRGVFHCFDGTPDVVADILSMGFYLGVGGILTFKKSNLPATLGNNVPLNKILLETDAPYLAPMPYRGSRNEPSFIEETLNKLAQVYNLSPIEVDAFTTKNAKKLFSL